MECLRRVSRILPWVMVVACAANKPAPTPAAVAPALDARSALVRDAAALRDEMCECRVQECVAATESRWNRLRKADQATWTSAEWTLTAIESNVEFCKQRVGDAATTKVAIAAFRRAADAMCKCKDRSCATQVGFELEELSKRYQDVKAPPADAKVIQSIVHRYLACATRASGIAGGQPLDPNGNPVP